MHHNEGSGLERGKGEDAMATGYMVQEPSRDEVNQMKGTVLLEFGTDW
jgi:hypothetical protein